MSGLDLEAPSRSQVEKAGKRLRKIFRGELPMGAEMTPVACPGVPSVRLTCEM